MSEIFNNPRFEENDTMFDFFNAKEFGYKAFLDLIEKPFRFCDDISEEQEIKFYTELLQNHKEGSFYLTDNKETDEVMIYWFIDKNDVFHIVDESIGKSMEVICNGGFSADVAIKIIVSFMENFNR